MALALLYELHGKDLFELPLACVERVAVQDRPLFLRMLAGGLNSPPTSSCGRLFDGIAALLGVRQVMTYEGQAAMELEGVAERGEAGQPLPMPVAASGGKWLLDWRPLVAGVLHGVLAGGRAPDLAATFHVSLAMGSAALCRQIRAETGLERVALSGGVFQNRLLSEQMVSLLAADGFQVFCHRLVPPGDGGLALGQAVIAGRVGACA